MALLEKSLQVTEAIEARWIEAQDEARDVGRQRDSVVHLLEGTRRQLESTQAELDRARDQLQGAVEAAAAELAERDDSIQQLENDLAEARRALDQQLQEWQLDQQQSQEGISILLAERDQARAEIDQLVHRLSWRITAPLRTALTWLRRLRS